MIIRKPYAFLIKNFKKIHIVLLFLSLFVAYKLAGVNRFINQFMETGIYDPFSNQIAQYVSIWVKFSLILIVVGSVSLLILLRYKGKPWKIYLIPIIEYFFLFLVLNMITSFFKTYSIDINPLDIKFSRDLLVIFLLVQFPAIGIFGMRTLGLDYKKFKFNSDQEFLELSEKDREEIEIAIDFDINSLKRLYRRTIRNINYFYIEHKKICITVGVVLLIIFVNRAYNYIFIVNKTYKEGDIYNANGLTIKVNKSYFTDKDDQGNVISKNNNFVIIDFTITNNGSEKKINMDNFHLKNKRDFTTTNKTYATEFMDLGRTYDSVKVVKRGETINFIIVFKVDSNLKKNRFNLYYQEDGGILRKIKIKLKDVSKIEDVEKFELLQNITVPINYKEDTISFDYFEFKDLIKYVTRKCTREGCSNVDNELISDGTYKIMEIEFGSEYSEAKNMVDFLVKYGKINYKDSSGEDGTIEIKNALSRTNTGKTIYLKAPIEIVNATEVNLELLVRNKHYIYKFV